MEGEPKIENSFIQNTIKELRGLRTKYSDEMRKEIKHSTDEDKLYKVRNAWFTALGLQMSKLMKANNDGAISLSRKTIENIELFEGEFENSKFSLRDTTEKDINLANRIIDEILEELEQISIK